MKKVLDIFYFPILGLILFFLLDKLNVFFLLYSKTTIIYYLCDLIYEEKKINYNNSIGLSIAFTGFIFFIFFTPFLIIFKKKYYIKIGLYISIVCSLALIAYGLW